MKRNDMISEKTDTIKGILLGLLAIVAIVVVSVLVTQTIPQENSIPKDQIFTVTPTDHVIGNAHAPVTLYEFADLQCPSCAAYYPIIKELSNSYTDKVRVVFRHFPLRTLHKNALSAAYAAEAASNQGKFWEMIELLYARQDEWSATTDFGSKARGYARDLGLNAERFVADMNSQGVKDRVAHDEKEAASLALRGTPSFFLNGNPLSIPFTLEELKSYIDDLNKPKNQNAQ